MTDSFSLRINAAANDSYDNSEPVNGVADTERLVDFLLPRSPVEVLVHGFAIDQNRATFIQVKTHLGNGSLPFTRSVEIFLLSWSLSLYQVSYLPYF